ncbi:MAG: TetR family transcriptional regulator [Desulfamplus sp.]|nr:TetR family transcriptional regulator [Desulfamplus sp.]
MNYAEFKNILEIREENLYRDVYLENQDAIRIKKEATAVKNFEKIFNSVFEITYEKGFQAMTMRDLSCHTKLSLGALYGYFSGKEELLAIIHKQGNSMIRKIFGQFYDPQANPVEQLRTLIKAHMFLSESARPWFYFTFMEARNLTPTGREAVLSMEEYTENMLLEILEAGETEGIFIKRDHVMTASLIKAMQQDWYLKRWKYKKRGITVDTYTEYLIDFTISFISL